MSPAPRFPQPPLPALGEAYATAERLAREWGVTVEGEMPGATGSLVLAAGEFVLRLPLEGRDSGGARAFAPHGGIAVLREDPASGATLLPRLRPGSSLDSIPEDEAVEAWIALVRRLRNAQGDAPSVEDSLDPLWNALTELRFATDVPALARRLVDTSPPPRLLHGDLHHFNVLRSGDEWVAIDPEGVTGDPAYEPAAFLRNPVPALADEPNLPGLLRRRIHRLAVGLDDDPARIWGWAMVRTALCVWQGLGPLGPPWLVVARALDVLGPEFAQGLC